MSTSKTLFTILLIAGILWVISKVFFVVVLPTVFIVALFVVLAIAVVSLTKCI